jgi:hypothetical protein
MTDHKPLPVHGYTEQSQERVDLVNEGKQLEEQVLRYIEKVGAFLGDASTGEQRRWLAIGKTNIQTGWMAAFRSIFNPQRIEGDLP